MNEHRSVHQCNADLETRAKLRAEGRQAEQASIIRLLEEDAKQYCSCKWGYEESESGEIVERQEVICDPHRYIALIRKKDE